MLKTSQNGDSASAAAPVHISALRETCNFETSLQKASDRNLNRISVKIVTYVKSMSGI